MSTWDSVKLFLNQEIIDPIIIKYKDSYSVAVDKTYRYRNPSSSTGEIEQYVIITIEGQKHNVDVNDCEYFILDLNKMNELFIYKQLDAIFQSYKLKYMKEKIVFKIEELKNELKKIKEKDKLLKKIHNLNI